MHKFAKTGLLATLLLPCVALADVSPGKALGTTEAEIRTALVQMGYDVKEIEVEDDEIEAEASINGQLYEIEVAVDTGLVLEVELEDEEDGDDD